MTLEQVIPTKEDMDQEKAIELIQKMDAETGIKFIKQCAGLDMLLHMTIPEAVTELVEILIGVKDEYPNGYSDFIEEVEDDDFTLTHKKKGE